MVNLWIGMCRGVPGVPRDLYNWGYEDRWIEHKFQNQDRESVHPDLILASTQSKNTLLLEFKSGANTDEDQLRRYSRVSGEDLVREAFLEVDATETHDVVVIGTTAQGDRLSIGIVDGGYDFPLIGDQPTGLALLLNEFQRRQLTDLFTPFLSIDWQRAPTGFIRIVPESADWEIAEVVGPAILARMSRRESAIGIDDLCIDVCDTWGIMGRPAKNEISARVSSVVRQAADGPFRAYIRIRGSRIRVTSNPLDWRADKASAAYRKLLTAQRDLIAYLRAGGAEQLQLFEHNE